MFCGVRPNLRTPQDCRVKHQREDEHDDTQDVEDPMTFAEVRLQHPFFDTESVSSPLAAAISEHRAAEGELAEVLPDGALRTYWVKAVPFFDAGRYLGAATYMTVIAERPSV
jgi:hypothetical protein